MRARDDRGLSTGTVMLALMLLVVLAFTLASLSTTHLQLTTRSNLDIRASNLARSTAALAIARLMENQEFGKSGEVVELETDAGQGLVSFDPEIPRTEDFAASTNNLGGTEAIPGGFGEPVPSETVHIVARGESGGVMRTVEVVLRVPSFPWAVAAGGTVETRRGVLIGSLPEGVWPPPPESELLPADLLANSTDDEAIVLGSDSTILGDVETPGKVKLNGNVSTIKVEGEIRSGTRPAQLPELRAADYDPAASGRSYDDLNSLTDPGQTVVLTGAGRREGDLTISSGLELQGSHLFVDGDLTIRGGLKGNGVLVCTGNVNIESGLTLDGATEVAVVADGHVSLKGNGKASSTVRGLFYAGQGLEAEEMTLVGTLLAGEAASGIELENMSFYAEEPQPVTVSGGGAQSFYLGLETIGRHHTGVIQEVGVLDYSQLSPNTTPLAVLSVQPGPNGGFPMTVTLGGRGGGEQFVVDSEAGLDSLGSRASIFLTGNLPRGQDIDRLAPLQDAIASYDFKAQIGGSSTGEESVSVELFGDISRFLPFEDRVRVVSWLER